MSDWRGPRYSGLNLTAKLALLFSGVVLFAFAVAYFYTVPELRSNLQEQTLLDLEQASTPTADEVERVMGEPVTNERLEGIVGGAADRADARITVIGVQRSADGSRRFYTVSDSLVSAEASGEDASPFEPPPEGLEDEGLDTETLEVSLGVTDEALASGALVRGLGRTSGQLTAQVAVPLRRERGAEPEWVALYSRQLDSVADSVGFIEQRLLVAGGLAVLVALAGGYLVARALARRVRRLESAAGKLADGESVERLPVDSEDELGHLTRAFNEMQAKLARVDRSRREFIANASHELRTPIFSLGGFAELIEDEELDAQTREGFVRSMREQIDRLQRLASDLLDLSRLDAGSLEIHASEVDLGELVSVVSGEFAPLAAQRRAELELDLPPDRVEAWCDPERAAQIVRILVDNALRHTEPGTEVRVSARRTGRSAELSVTDAGPGLSPAVQGRVFDRFFTADSAGGSGLGLAIAQELTQRMTGDLSLVSAPGRTKFTLSLPAAVVPPSGKPERPLSVAGSRG